MPKMLSFESYFENLLKYMHAEFHSVAEQSLMFGIAVDICFVIAQFAIPLLVLYHLLSYGRRALSRYVSGSARLRKLPEPMVHALQTQEDRDRTSPHHELITEHLDLIEQLTGRDDERSVVACRQLESQLKKLRELGEVIDFDRYQSQLDAANERYRKAIKNTEVIYR